MSKCHRRTIRQDKDQIRPDQLGCRLCRAIPPVSAGVGGKIYLHLLNAVIPLRLKVNKQKSQAHSDPKHGAQDILICL